MKLILSLTGAALIAALIAPGAAMAAGDKAKICTKAEKRYQKLFGKPSSKEDVVIVKMYKYTFCPMEVTVKPGTVVRWVNVDFATSHSTWFKEAGKEESERLFPEEKTEMKFDLPPGEYPYLCGPHWQSDNMIGKVIVAP